MEPAAKSIMADVAKKLTSDEMQNLLAFWTYHVENATRLEATPIVVDGVMYVTNSNVVHALVRARAAESGNTTRINPSDRT